MLNPKTEWDQKLPRKAKEIISTTWRMKLDSTLFLHPRLRLITAGGFSLDVLSWCLWGAANKRFQFMMGRKFSFLRATHWKYCFNHSGEGHVFSVWEEMRNALFKAPPVGPLSYMGYCELQGGLHLDKEGWVLMVTRQAFIQEFWRTERWDISMFINNNVLLGSAACWVFEYLGLFLPPQNVDAHHQHLL